LLPNLFWIYKVIM